MKRIAVIIVTAALVLGASSAAQAVPPKTYANCSALNRDYPHGVAKKGASDKSSGARVTSFKVSPKVYNLNTKSDRDKDGIACEKK